MHLREKFLSRKIMICTVLTAMLIVATGFVWGQKSVQVVADGKTIVVSTLKRDPGKIITQAGIQLNEKDEYRLSTEKVTDNTKITVYRAVPVSITYKGTTRNLMTGKPTVGELIDEMGIQGNDVRVTPDRNTKISSDVHIKMVEIAEKIIERSEEEQYQVIRQPDAMMEKGQEEIVEYGENGSKIVKIKEHFDDGVKVSEEVIEETITKPAKPEIIKVGARDTIDTSRGAMRFRRSTYMEATAYLPTDGGGSGITATGIVARHGVVAVDPNVIPLGARLYIPGYGVAIAADTGGAIQGNIIDLCMESYSEAINFGRRTVKVYILD